MADGWTQLINSQLLATQKVVKGAICGVDGTVWGISNGFSLAPEEISSASKAFNNQQGVLSTGLKFEGEKYFVLQADDERIMGKKASRGFFIYKTKQAIIIAIYGDGTQPEQCSKVTGALADYFKSIGY